MAQAPPLTCEPLRPLRAGARAGRGLPLVARGTPIARVRPTRARACGGKLITAQPFTGLGDPTGGRYRPRRVPASPVTQRAGDLGRDLLVVILGEQAQRHRQMRRHMRRQLSTRPLLPGPARRYRRVDRVPRHRHPPLHPWPVITTVTSPLITSPRRTDQKSASTIKIILSYMALVLCVSFGVAVRRGCCRHEDGVWLVI